MKIVSNILLKSIFNKLKLEVLPKLEKDKVYADCLLSNSLVLRKVIKPDDFTYKKISSEIKLNEKVSDEEFLVSYIISVTFTKVNTKIHISDTKGNSKHFYTSGSVGLIGKQKKKREIALVRLLELVKKKITYIGKKPVAVHFCNVKSHRKLIVNILKQHFFIKVITNFNKIPHNGCRNKKLRRKKYLKSVNR